MNQVMDSIQIRRRTPLPAMAYAVYLYFSGHSLRRASKSLRLTMSRSHASIWRWVQRLGPVLGSFGADPRDVHRIFVDETMVNVGGTSALIWVAFEPDLRAMPDLHVSPRGNSIDAYLFIRRLVRRYGRVPIYTDGAGWYADACRWAGVEHVVYGRPLRNPMSAERMVQYVKDGTEAFDDPFPARPAGAGSRPGAPSSTCPTGSQRSRSCSCTTSCSITGAWGGLRLSGGRRRCPRG